ncbi:hypothetical protein [Haloferax sp. Atlit-6N]|nr:hypothetical protein [Haloferax sp. Atlit-6N]
MDSALRKHLLLIEFFLLVLIVIGVFAYGSWWHNLDTSDSDSSPSL